MSNTILTPAVALYKAPHFTGYDNNNTITLNADQIGAFTPRPGYLKRYLVPGQNQVQYLLTFEPTSAELLDPNTILGVYVEQNGAGVLIDCISVANLDAALNGTGNITQNYAGGIPLFVSPAAVAYCLVRADNGSSYAHDKVTLDYVLQSYGNIAMRSSFSGISHYTIYSFQPPIPQTPVGPGTSGQTDIISLGACSS